MPSDPRSLVEKIQSSYKDLEQSASALNSVSDELGKSIEAFNLVLKGLNLGVSTWVNVNGYDFPEGSYHSEDIGYDKVGNKWGISLRTVSGHYTMPDEESVSEWLFNDAPRALRLAAIDKLPDLLEALAKAADDAAKRVALKLETAKSVAAALLEVAPQARVK
jgi:hypothetical protein